MTRNNKKPRARNEARDNPVDPRPLTLSARDPLAYAAALKILG